MKINNLYEHYKNIYTMKKIVTMFTICLAFSSIGAQVSKEKQMDEYISRLMSKMTLEEKIGQLNFPSEGDITTGIGTNTNSAEKIRKGLIGGMFNIKGVDKIKKIQRIAVEESRMKIPILFGMDVIHGYETVFPIPLGLAASWDISGIEKTAQIAATLFGRDIEWDNRTEDELTKEALEIAAKSDIIVAAMGEASEMSGESSSRTDIGIPDVQKRLLAKLVQTGKPVVLVLFAGRPMTLVWESENVPAILNVWFGGSEAAQAIADVVYGNVNPSGKLPSTFPRSVAQIPLYYNHLNTGRPASDKGFEKFRSNYMDEKNAPLYPFGYGLSYTKFEYSNITLDKKTMNDKDKITASVTVKNTGSRDGAEVVQMYIRDLVASISRPVKELKGFEKIWLKAGESKTVNFVIDNELLKFYNSDLKFVSEPGNFEVMIGTNSDNVKKETFELKN